MSTRLYVGNIPFSSTEEELREVFARYGSVTEVKLMTDRETGRPRGFAFVSMDETGASDAIEALDQADFGGRRLTVNVARERAGGGGNGRARQDRHGWS